MKTQWKILVVTVLVAASGFLWLKWRTNKPRRQCAGDLQALGQSLNSKDLGALLVTVVLPQAIENRTAAEQGEFLEQALQGEISPAGVVEFRERGTCGAVKDVFPAEGTRWATQAGAKPEDCVAFKMEHAGIRAEVVLRREGQTFRIVRCNNVRQMHGVKVACRLPASRLALNNHVST